MDIEWHTKSRNPYRKLQRNMLLELCQGKKVLDIGGGTGRTANDLKSRGYDVTVLDMDPRLIDYGKKHFKGIEFVRGNAVSFTTKEKFDEVILEHIIEHIDDQQRVIQNVYKCLRPGGRLIISTPNKWVYRAFLFFGRIATLKLSEVFDHVPGHISELNPWQFKKLLNLFSETKIYGINPFFKPAKKQWALGIGMVAVCIKGNH